MKFLMVLLMSLALVGCTDYHNVMCEYKSGNKHAADLLGHGFNVRNSEYISTCLIERSLAGDESAKSIVYAQIESLRGTHSDYRYIPMCVPVVISR